MGMVYRARDRRVKRTVALKFLAPHLLQEEDAVRRFRREAESIAALNHPNIAVLYELGEWDGEPFLAMEYLPGGTLRERVRGRRLDLIEMLGYARDVGLGLAHAHRRGILHRDLKPGNVMFAEDGTLKLVDFGLARSEHAERLTETSSPLGTLAYLAPEVLRGEVADARVDQYAFGAVLREMAVGKPLFEARTVEALMHQIVSEPPKPLAEARPDLPAWFTSAVDRSLRKEPSLRHGSMETFLDALEITAASAEQPTRTMAPRARKASRRWALFAILAVLVAVLGAAYWQQRQSVPPQRTLVVLPFENLGKDPADEAFCDGLRETVTSLLTQAQRLDRSLLVIPSSEARRNGVRAPADASKAFNASLTLGGSVQRDEGKVRVILNLVNAHTLREEDSRILELNLAEPGAVERELSTSLQSMLGVPGGSPNDTGTRSAAAYEQFLRGQGALRNQQLEAAIPALEEAVRQDPSFVRARATLSEAYLRQHQRTQEIRWLAQADTEATKAVEQARTADALVALGQVRLTTGQSTSAIALFQEAVKLEPENVEAYRQLAEGYQQAGRIKEAEDTYLTAVRVRPGYWPTYSSLAVFYRSRGMYAKSEEALQTAIQIAPENYLLYRNAGAIYHLLGQYDKAIEMLRRSIALRPTAEAYSNLGVIYFFRGQYAESAVQAEKSVELGPKNVLNWGNLGDACWQLPDRRARAVEAFTKAASLAEDQLAINPKNIRLRRNYALYLAKLDRKKEAQQQIQRAVSEKPQDVDVLFMASRVFSLLNDRENALLSLKGCVRLGYSTDEIRREPDLANVRPDARFESLLKEARK
jgi:tetratricopeptide (TPR) repeat protein/TolB-like protein